MQLRGKSEPDEDEMGSVALMRHGAKVVAGSQDGVLSIFSWGYFNDCSDRFPGEHFQEASGDQKKLLSLHLCIYQ